MGNSGQGITIPGQLAMLSGNNFDCQILHQGMSCEVNCLSRFPSMFRYMAKLYLPIHLIPFLLYKRKQLRNEPTATIGHALYSFAKSILFLTLMVQGFRYNWCKSKNILNMIHPWHAISGGLICGWSLLLESNTRAMEIMLSIVPRFFETLLNYFASRNLLTKFKYGDILVFSIILSIIHYYYQNNPKALKQTYYKVFNKFWGVN